MANPIVKTVGEFAFVENVAGTANRLPPSGYDSWIDYWSKNARQPVPNVCQNDFCRHEEGRNEIVGAHVRFPSEEGVWIAPLCKACNSPNEKGLMMLPTGIKVVKVPS